MTLQDKKRESRAEQNQAYYGRSKLSKDHLLLRLDKGGKSLIDAAAHAAGLSRPAFFQLYLIPLCATFTAERLEQIARISHDRRLSIVTLLSELIDTAIENHSPDAAGSMPSVAVAFDELFNNSIN